MIKITKKTARVIVVESSSVIRASVASALSKIGYEHVLPVSSIQAAIDMLEVETVDWVLSCVGDLNNLREPNIFHLLKVSELHLPSIDVSAILDEQDFHLIPKLYQQGILSHHLRSSAFSDFKLSIEELASSKLSDPSLVAANYLRVFLDKKGEKEEVEWLNKKMLAHFPGNIDILKALSESQKKNGKGNESIISMAQSEIVALVSGAKNDQDKLKKYIDAIATVSKESKNVLTENVLNIKNCVVVDPDETMRNMLASSLVAVGCSDVQLFADGESADLWMQKNGTPALFMSEWKLKKMTGAALIQRVVSGFYRSSGSLPIVIVTSSVVERDKDAAALLTDVGVSLILKKPYGFSDALSMIVGAVAEKRSTKNISNSFAAFKLAVATGDADKATLERQKIVTHPSITKDLAAITDAEWYFAIGDYENAKKSAMSHIPKESPYFPQMLAVLGKALIKLGDFKAANDVLTKSMQASPLNLDRAARLVQAKAGLGDKDGVMSGVNILMAIDGSHPKVAETLKLAKDKLSKLGASDLGAIETMVAGSSASVLAVTSYHNNLGVALAKNGRYEDSIFHYLLAAEAAKDKTVPAGIRSMILYNLTLTMTKSGTYADALSTLKKAAVDADRAAPIMAKIESLALKLDDAIKSGKKVAINESKGGPSESAASKSAPSAIKQIRCLLGIYVPANKRFADVAQTSVTTPPRFIRRSAIVKEDLFPSREAANG